MHYALIITLACFCLSQNLLAQNTLSELIRTINHQLAEITVDNEFEKNIVYEVSLINREKLDISKSWTNYQGKRQEAHFAFSLRDMIEVTWKSQNNSTCFVILHCRENTVERPWMNEVILGNEAEIHCLKASETQMEKLVYSIRDLKERAVEAFFAQVMD
ncbi:MAG: hypothetical protein AAF502_25350 [Bacteroidota bacterium]